MKKFLLFCLVLACLCGTLTLSVFAASYSRVIYDDAGLIGKGTHERFTIKIESFMKKALERKG